MGTDTGDKPRPQGVRPAVPLTPERVVRVATQLIDDEGAEAFSIRSLAKALGVYPTAIYHHVGDRRRLLGLVGAAWMGEVVPPPDLDAPWDWLRTMAHAYRRAAHQHPHVARLIASELVNDTSSFALAEIIVGHLEAAGVPDEELVPAYNMSVAVTVGFVDLEFASVTDPSANGQQRVAADLHDLDPAQYPTLHRHAEAFVNRAFSLRWSSGEDVPMDESFDYVVDLLVSGLQRRADRTRDAR